MKQSTKKAANKSRILQNLKAALKEVKLHQQGKLKLRTAQEFLNEL